jgi:hypothetical protein
MGEVLKSITLMRFRIVYCNSDPDRAPLPSDRNLRPLVYRPTAAPFRVCRPPLCERPRHYCEPVKLLNFDVHADPDTYSIKNNADPDPQPCLCLLQDWLFSDGSSAVPEISK